MTDGRRGFTMLGIAAALAAASGAAAGQEWLLSDQDPRLSWGGERWHVKASTAPVGPGGNLFSSDPASVWVDRSDHLHLRIRHAEGRWWASEVILPRALGHGRYSWTVRADLSTLDPNVVLGLFTWDEAPGNGHHAELDWEIALWNRPDGTHAQCVVQPWDTDGNLVRVTLPTDGPRRMRFQIDWRPETVRCTLFLLAGTQETRVFEHVFTANPPPAGNANPRINLWLFDAERGLTGRDHFEVVIERFAFAPLR